MAEEQSLCRAPCTPLPAAPSAAATSPPACDPQSSALPAQPPVLKAQTRPTTLLTASAPLDEKLLGAAGHRPCISIRSWPRPQEQWRSEGAGGRLGSQVAAAWHGTAHASHHVFHVRVFTTSDPLLLGLRETRDFKDSPSDMADGMALRSQSLDAGGCAGAATQDGFSRQTTRGSTWCLESLQHNPSKPHPADGREVPVGHRGQRTPRVTY